jgi:hypothetical protein
MRTFLAIWLTIMGVWVGYYSGVTVKDELPYSLLGLSLMLCMVQDIKEITNH